MNIFDGIDELDDELIEYEGLEPTVRPRHRRDKLIDRMPEWKRDKNRRRRVNKSKPKGFKHRRKR